MTKISIIYYSSTGTTYKLAKAIEEGAKRAGAEVRFRKVKETAPEKAKDSNEAWAKHLKETKDIKEACLEDLEWADAFIFGSPTRYGLPTAQLKQFMDTTGGLWAKGALVNKIASSFTSTSTKNGGQESTILAMNTTFYHWGCIIVAPGYADPIQFKAGNPYGTSFVSNNGELSPDDLALDAGRFQGKHVAEITARFLKGA